MTVTHNKKQKYIGVKLDNQNVIEISDENEEKYKGIFQTNSNCHLAFKLF